MLLCVALSFVGCRNNENEPANNSLNGTTWQATLAASNVATFAFAKSTFTFTESNYALQETVVLKGSYTQTNSIITLKFTSATENVDFDEILQPPPSQVTN